MLNVIYEDNHIIVVEKPFNIPTQEDISSDKDFLNIVKEYIKIKYNKPGNVYAGLVHRLDRVAGGLMIFAKTSKAASRLSEQIRNHSFKKTYLTIVSGKLNTQKGILKDFLLKDRKNNFVKVVKNTTKDSKEAKLIYNLASYKDNLSLYNVELITGRSHQIRVQFSSRNCPIYGDVKYGSKYKNKDGICLWSNSISFIHPTQKEEMTFILMPPDKYPWNLFKI